MEEIKWQDDYSQTGEYDENCYRFHIAAGGDVFYGFRLETVSDNKIELESITFDVCGNPIDSYRFDHWFTRKTCKHIGSKVHTSIEFDLWCKNPRTPVLSVSYAYGNRTISVKMPAVESARLHRIDRFLPPQMYQEIIDRGITQPISVHGSKRIDNDIIFTYGEEQIPSTIQLEGIGLYCKTPILDVIKLITIDSLIWDHSSLVSEGKLISPNHIWFDGPFTALGLSGMIERFTDDTVFLTWKECIDLLLSEGSVVLSRVRLLK